MVKRFLVFISLCLSFVTCCIKFDQPKENRDETMPESPPSVTITKLHPNYWNEGKNQIFFLNLDRVKREETLAFGTLASSLKKNILFL